MDLGCGARFLLTHNRLLCGVSGLYYTSSARHNTAPNLDQCEWRVNHFPGQPVQGFSIEADNGVIHIIDMVLIPSALAG
jgi:hypothetical protein